MKVFCHICNEAYLHIAAAAAAAVVGVFQCDRWHLPLHMNAFQTKLILIQPSLSLPPPTHFFLLLTFMHKNIHFY